MIGHPIEHSRSPAIHNAGFRAVGLDWVYVAFEVAPGSAPAALQAMRVLGLGGLSVTMPHKDDAAASVDVLTPSAEALAAVNCVAQGDDGRLVGHNTDGEGFLRSLEEAVSFGPAGRRCLVAGAGGAARAVVLALAAGGASEVTVANRTPERGEQAAALAGGAGRVVDPADDRAFAEATAHAELVVNATPVGMGGVGGDVAWPVPVSALHPGQVVADLVYQPRRTALLVAAAAQGAATVDGLGMLVHQAALAFEIWTGVPAPLPALWRAAEGSDPVR